jgi:hypothetical protein
MVQRIFLIFFAASVCLSIQAAPAPVKGNSDPAIPLLRIRLVKDAYNYDEIAIGFDAETTTVYNNRLDSRYMEGINAYEGLSSLSADSVQLSVNIVPLPHLGPLVIRLDVEAAASGTFTLERTELDSIPAIYDIWLMDKFGKDSLDLRAATSYVFNVDKKNGATFGSNRFQVVIRQNPSLGMHLLSFEAIKASPTTQLSWKTENEENTTVFTVERSIDDGSTFFLLDTLLSNAAGAYNYTDKTPLDGSDAYRIKITDLNGTISFSNVISISFGNAVSESVTSTNNINIYPNPSNGIINLAISPAANTSLSLTSEKQATTATTQTFFAATQGNASYEIKLFNVNGALIKEATSSSASWQTNVSALSPGTYIIRVTNNSDNTLVGKSTFIKL